MKRIILLTLCGGMAFAGTGTETSESAVVIDVYDGDTITVRYESGETTKVRLIGIDTPEIANNRHGPASTYGPVSRDYLDALLVGRRVELEYDVTKTDTYDRTLAYVYLPNGTMANDQMLRAGYALLYTVPPNVKYVDQFTAAQNEARNGDKGLWGLGALVIGAKKPETSSPARETTTTIAENLGTGCYITKTGKKFHQAGCRYLSKSAIAISKENAYARGYTPCSVCIGSGTKTYKKSSPSTGGRCAATTKKGTR